MYPGQSYFWLHNANIRRAEERFMEEMEKGAGHPSGVHSTQKECRDSLPPASEVKTAVEEAKGTTIRIARKQTERGVN